MTSRISLWASQASLIIRMRFFPTPSTSPRRLGCLSMTSRVSLPNRETRRLAMTGPIPLMRPDPRYFSIPRTPAGTMDLWALTLNWSPYVEWVVQSPQRSSSSPGAIPGMEPTTVTRSFCPFKRILATVYPFSSF